MLRFVSMSTHTLLPQFAEQFLQFGNVEIIVEPCSLYAVVISFVAGFCVCQYLQQRDERLKYRPVQELSTDSVLIKY